MSLSTTSRLSCTTNPTRNPTSYRAPDRSKTWEARSAERDRQEEALPRVGWPRTCPGDPTPAREREHDVRSRSRSRSRGRRRGGTDVLVEEVAVDGPVERVLERPAVEQAHPLLLRRPPRQVPSRRRHRPRRRSFVLSFPFSLSSRCSSSRVGTWEVGGRIRTPGHGLSAVYGLFGLLAR